MNWFWKTFTGYTVCHTDGKKDIFFVHKPFKRPYVYSKERLNKINGTTFEGIFIDEIGG